MTNGTGRARPYLLGFRLMPDARHPNENAKTMWLSVIGVIVTTAPLMQQMVLHPDRDLPKNLWPWLACIAGFLVADQLAVRTTRPTRRLALFACASACACIAVWLIPVIYGGAALTATLLVVVAARLHHFPRKVAYTWIGLQTAVLLSIYVSRWKPEVGGAATFGFFCFQIIGFRFASIAASERQARIELKHALDDLSATRDELTHAARRAERNQIAADLHDVLGHHLVALQLQLEAANDSPKHLTQAKQLARMLLAEVRGVVDELQDKDPFDLIDALEPLTSDDTSPRVTLEVVDAATVRTLTGAAAKECFRAVQEAVTNARKHAAATTVAIRVDRESIGIRDDGRSWEGPPGGRGLDGMADRCRTAGCTFTLERAPGTGTHVRIGLPQRTGIGGTS